MVVRWLPLLALLASAAAFAQAPAAPKQPTAKVDASAPIEKKDATGKFQKKHAEFLERGKAGPIGVLFLGDSITEGWGKAPHVWEHYYGKLQPANFGIGGDQTQHVVWRIENGELDPMEGRQRLASDPDSEYSSIDVDEMIPPPDPGEPEVDDQDDEISDPDAIAAGA